jgi:hypothetical protein
MLALAIILCFGIGATFFTFTTQVSNGPYDLITGVIICGVVMIVTLNIPLFVLSRVQENR